MRHIKKIKLLLVALLIFPGLLGGVVLTSSASAAYKFDSPTTSTHGCGSKEDLVRTTINFGCKGESCAQGQTAGYCSVRHSAVIDMTFAIIKFLSYGVGLIVVASMIVAGIQYTTSRGDPKAVAMAEQRIKSTVAALLIFIFAYAILNYIIPAGFFGQ
jgi:heme A synthase